MNDFKSMELKMTEKELDQALESSVHQQLKEAVRSMPEDTLSMSWRSELNQKLMVKIEAKQKKRRFAWILSPALGLGLAGALAVVVMTKSPITPSVNSFTNVPHIEESLVASHQDALRYSDITGVGLSPEEVISQRSNSVDLNEVDLGSL